MYVGVDSGLCSGLHVDMWKNALNQACVGGNNEGQGQIVQRLQNERRRS